MNTSESKVICLATAKALRQEIPELPGRGASRPLLLGRGQGQLAGELSTPSRYRSMAEVNRLVTESELWLAELSGTAQSEGTVNGVGNHSI